VVLKQVHLLNPSLLKMPLKHGRNPRGGQGGRSPKNFGWGDDIAHIPPNKLSAQLRKIIVSHTFLNFVKIIISFSYKSIGS